MLLYFPLFKPQSKDTPYAWFSSLKRLIWCIYRCITFRSFSIYVSCSSINCWIVAVVSFSCIFSYVFCISFSASIHLSSRICVRSRSAAVHHSCGSPYRRQWTDYSWVVPPFWGQYCRFQWLISLSLHLLSICFSDPFKLSDPFIFYLKRIMEFTRKAWNVSLKRRRQVNQCSFVIGIITLFF